MQDMVKDSESVYGGPATDALLRGAESLSTAKVLFEFGHGSGRLALRLLKSELPEDCRYVGVRQRAAIADEMMSRAHQEVRIWGKGMTESDALHFSLPAVSHQQQ